MSLTRPPWVDRAELLGVSPSASEQTAAQALCALTCLQPLCTLSAPSLHPLCTLYVTSLQPSALYAPSLRPLVPSLRPLFALSPPSLHFCACSVHPLHSNQAVVVRQRAPASSCVVRPGACRPATALPHPRWLRSHPFSSLRTAPPPTPPHPPTLGGPLSALTAKGAASMHHTVHHVAHYVLRVVPLWRHWHWPGGIRGSGFCLGVPPFVTATRGGKFNAFHPTGTEQPQAPLPQLTDSRPAAASRRSSSGGW